MKYEEPSNIGESDFIEIMKNGDEQQKVLALIGCGLHGELSWSASALCSVLSDDDDVLATAAATALGHLFRRYKHEDLRAERDILAERHAGEERLKSAIQNALDDYDIFHPSGFR